MNRRGWARMAPHPSYAYKTRNRDMRFCNPRSLPDRRGCRGTHKFLCKILLPLARSSFTSLEVFYDCSGGNSRPSHPSGVGGGNFLQTKVCPLLLLVLLLNEDSANRKRPTRLRHGYGVAGALRQRSIPNSAISGRVSWPVAFTLVAMLIATLAVIILWRIETWPARTAQQTTDQLERLGKDLRAAFIDIAHLQPRIT